MWNLGRYKTFLNRKCAKTEIFPHPSIAKFYAGKFEQMEKFCAHKVLYGKGITIQYDTMWYNTIQCDTWSTVKLIDP